MKKILAIVMILAVVAAMVIPLAVSAATGGTTEIDATIGAALELTAPNPTINLGTMDPSTQLIYTASATNNGIVKCNSALGYQVTVVSDKTDGKMASVTPHTLGAALKVTTGLVSAQAVTSGTPLTVVDESAPGTSGIALSVSQTITYSDAADAGYAIVLTYTATAK